MVRLRLTKRTGASHWQGNPIDRRWFHHWGQVTRGSLYKKIAAALGVSQSTVRAHLHSIYGKLHVRTRTEAVLKYLAPRP